MLFVCCVFVIVCRCVGVPVCLIFCSVVSLFVCVCVCICVCVSVSWLLFFLFVCVNLFIEFIFKRIVYFCYASRIINGGPARFRVSRSCLNTRNLAGPPLVQSPMFTRHAPGQWADWTDEQAQTQHTNERTEAGRSKRTKLTNTQTHTSKQTNKQSNKHTHKQTNKQTHKQTNTITHRAVKQTDRQTDRQTD